VTARLALRIALCTVAAATSLARGEPAEYRTWSEYGGGPSQIKYSSLRQIDRSNVEQLEVAWTYDAGGASAEQTDYNATQRFQHTPIVIGDVLYAVGADLRVFALDAATGKMLWEHPLGADEKTAGPGGVALRGLMQWRGKRIFYTAGPYLRALDAKTGKPIESFGDGGRVDLREGLGRPAASLGVAATSPGVVFDDLIIMGSAVSESLPAAPGHVRAYDVQSGELRWIFHTIPQPGEFGYDTWPPDAWGYLGGANSWGGMSVDRERGTVFFGTGSATYDFYGANRHGANLFANCLVALDAHSGKRLWHYQFVHHDVWDRDLPAAPALVTVERDGRRIDAVAQTTKTGHVFVFDRETGEPLFPIEEHPEPASRIPGEQLAATQPLPVKPPPFARQAYTEDMIPDRNPAVAAYVRQRLESLTVGGQFIPPDTKGQVLLPGFDGGGEWGGPAFDPETDLLYVNANEMPWLLQLRETEPLQESMPASAVYSQLCATCHGEDRQGSGGVPALTGIASRYGVDGLAALIRTGGSRMPAFAGWLDDRGAHGLAEFLIDGEDTTIRLKQENFPLHLRYELKGYELFLDNEGYPAVKPPWGTLTAIDLDKGELAWQVPLGEYPQLVERGIRNTGSMNYGGPVVTAGGLLFIAATLFDNKIRAFDKTTGELLWEHVLPNAGAATPAVYEAAGREFVVIAAGGSKFGDEHSDMYVAFTLPEGDRSPE
jgi:quinoprotein glucose dehydrogenase